MIFDKVVVLQLEKINKPTNVFQTNEEIRIMFPIKRFFTQKMLRKSTFKIEDFIRLFPFSNSNHNGFTVNEIDKN